METAADIISVVIERVKSIHGQVNGMPGKKCARTRVAVTFSITAPKLRPSKP